MFPVNLFLPIKDFLFPSTCALCDKSLIGYEEIGFGLCADCKESIAIDKSGKCNLCGKPLVSEIDTCLPCRNSEHTFDRLWVLYPYTGKYRRLLTAYKFGKKLAIADFFAQKINEVINSETILQDAVLVPVPPRPGKIKHSGWDQVDNLVKTIEKTSNRNVSRILKRRKSKIQKELNRAERLENLKGRIYTEGSAPEIVLIIDDVITTGSTMEVCAQVLKEAGARKVYGLCLFYD
jgi:ComF family protein